jgi:hypothetical protein
MSFLSSVFGSKPQVADYTPVDLTEEQLKALEGNIANFPQFEALGNLYQNFMLNQLDTAFGGANAFRNILAQGGQSIQDMLGESGKLRKADELYAAAEPFLKGEIRRTFRPDLS